jgi:hypothetical protein
VTGVQLIADLCAIAWNYNIARMFRSEKAMREVEAAMSLWREEARTARELSRHAPETLRYQWGKAELAQITNRLYDIRSALNVARYEGGKRSERILLRGLDKLTYDLKAHMRRFGCDFVRLRCP